MSPSDLAARLEKIARKEQYAVENLLAGASYAELNEWRDMAKDEREKAITKSQLAADLRAAAVAVRLVGECREALAAIRNEVSAGCHSDAPVEELKTGIHYEPVLVVDTVIEKIAEWEGKHV